jgi:diguanylate cyclase (GGDEF)-like protein
MADKEGAARVAQTLLEALAQPYPLEGEPHLVSASIGITLFPQDAAGSAELRQTADQAIYTAKRLGRNRYQLYSPNAQNGRR